MRAAHGWTNGKETGKIDPMPAEMLKRINFNAKFDERTNSNLEALAHRQDCSKAQVVRSLIRQSYEMTHLRNAQCADGQACRCPHAHIYGPNRIEAPPDPDRPV